MIGRTRRHSRTRLLPLLLAPAGALGLGAAAYLLSRRRGGAGEATVAEAMTRDPRTVRPSASVAEAATLMRTEDAGSLPVVDDGRLVGMVTDRDLALRVVADGRDAGTTTVGEVASAGPVTVEPRQRLSEASRLMAKHQVRRLPVVEEGRLVGILAQADVALEGADASTGDLVEDVSRPAGGTA